MNGLTSVQGVHAHQDTAGLISHERVASPPEGHQIQRKNHLSPSMPSCPVGSSALASRFAAPCRARSHPALRRESERRTASSDRSYVVAFAVKAAEAAERRPPGRGVVTSPTDRLARPMKKNKCEEFLQGAHRAPAAPTAPTVGDARREHRGQASGMRVRLPGGTNAPDGGWLHCSSAAGRFPRGFPSFLRNSQGGGG